MNELDEYIQTLEEEIKALEDQALEKHGYTPAMMQKLVIDIQNLEYDEEKLREKLVLDCDLYVRLSLMLNSFEGTCKPSWNVMVG